MDTYMCEYTSDICWPVGHVPAQSGHPHGEAAPAHEEAASSPAWDLGGRHDGPNSDAAERRRAKAMRRHEGDRRYKAMTIELEIMGARDGDAHCTQDALFDTGAGITLFGDAFIHNLRLTCPGAIVLAEPPRPDAVAACGAGGHPLEMVEDVCLRIRVGGVVELVWGHVVRGLAIPMLLGTGTQTKWGAMIDVPAQQVKLRTHGVTVAANTSTQAWRDGENATLPTPHAAVVVGGALARPQVPARVNADGTPLPGDVLRVVATDRVRRDAARGQGRPRGQHV